MRVRDETPTYIVRLTEGELEADLWCIHTVALAYSHEPPSGSVLDGLKRKLLDAQCR